MSIPDTNNVYGTLTCSRSLEKVAELLKYRVGLIQGEIQVKTSAFDGTQTLQIKTALFEFETTKTKNPNEYFLNGAVAGTNDEIIQLVRQIHQILLQGGYPAQFEIYDKKFTFVEAVG